MKKKKIRVLYIDDIPTPYRLGLHQCISDEQTLDYKVLFCAKNEPGRDWDIDFGTLNHSIMKGKQFRPRGQINPFSYKLNLCVVSEIREFEPDVVILSGYAHPTMWIASFWCRKNRVHYGMACETSNASEISSSGLSRKLKNLLVAPTIKGVSFGLPISIEAGEFLRELSGNSLLPVYRFPNTPDISLYKNQRVVSAVSIAGKTDLIELGVPDKKNNILFVGRLIEAKRPVDLLNGFQRLPVDVIKNTNLIYIGDGPLKSELASRVLKEYTVHFLGWVKDSELLARIMLSSNIFVLPSGHEPWGAVVNEAMASGLIVITSDQVGASKDMIVNGENGYMYPVGQVEELTALLDKVVTQDMTADVDMSESAIRTADEFGHNFAVNNFLCGINHVIESEHQDLG